VNSLKAGFGGQVLPLSTINRRNFKNRFQYNLKIDLPKKNISQNIPMIQYYRARIFEEKTVRGLELSNLTIIELRKCIQEKFSDIDWIQSQQFVVLHNDMLLDFDKGLISVKQEDTLVIEKKLSELKHETTHQSIKMEDIHSDYEDQFQHGTRWEGTKTPIK